jgi:hypothetical protein
MQNGISTYTKGDLSACAREAAASSANGEGLGRPHGVTWYLRIGNGCTSLHVDYKVFDKGANMDRGYCTSVLI